ncbi:MAG: rhizopine catabolism protein [Rhodospirillaceae bacterium]|nr:rhizopine catabolism protein [Rhodospirillaceae bacterium]MBT6118327.1 rhizopine catabolism protein [Rhodospirillaceae bacterium]
MEDWVSRKDLIDARRLKELSRRSDTLAWLQVLSQFAALGVTGYGIHALWGSLWVVPVFLFHGAILWGFTYAGQHELVHLMVFRSRALNDFFGHLASFLRIYPNSYQRFLHFTHHRHTKVAGLDPELLAQKPWTFWGYLNFLAGPSYWIGQIRITVGHALGHAPEAFLKEKERRIVIREARLYLLGYALIAVLSVTFQTWAAVIYWWGPILAATPFYRFYTAAEHHGRPNSASVIESTRTTKAGPVLRWLMWQMPYHTEHHLFPGVPFHKLGALCRELRERPDSRLKGVNEVAPGYFAVHREIVAMIRRGEDPTFLAEAARA